MGKKGAGGGWLPKRDEKEWGSPLRIVIPSAAEGSFSFPFSGAGMYNKKEFIHAFFVRAVRGKP